jgi:hypothetical protein
MHFIYNNLLFLLKLLLQTISYRAQLNQLRNELCEHKI